MNSYPPIIDSISSVKLRDEIKQFNPLKSNGFTTNKWIGIHDEPENTIEKYIQDSFDFYLASQYPTAVGFEWCIYLMTSENTGIPLHCDHDEKIRENEEGRMEYPLCSTITYLTNNSNPDIIFNTENGKHIDELIQFPPSEAYFSLPEIGKFVTFNSRYIRGVYPGDNEGRITLCYSVWHYKPKGLDRVGIVSKPFDCRFYRQTESQPVTWLGRTKNLNTNLYDKRFTFKYPDKYNEGETWKVTQ